MQHLFSTIKKFLNTAKKRAACLLKKSILIGLVAVFAVAMPGGIAWGQNSFVTGGGAKGLGGGVASTIVTTLLAATVAPWIGIAVGILSALNGLGMLLVNLIMFAFMAIIQIDFAPFLEVGTAVDTVWRVMRDLSNMFFIIVMMAIAFGTMLKLESYKWQRMLPKLALMALLINFSKTIALIILDIGQVVMMTFVNAFRDIAVGNIFTATRLLEPFKISFSGGISGPIQGLVSMAMTTIIVYTTFFVMLVILVLLLFRTALLWVFIAISPVAYITNILDATKKHASKWWSMYIKLVLFGPCLAFFLWFTFLFVAGGDGVLNKDNLSGNISGDAIDTSLPFGSSDATTPYNFTNFLIGIILLIVGTGMALQSSDIVGGIGQKAATGLWGWGKKKGGISTALMLKEKGFANKLGALPVIGGALKQPIQRFEKWRAKKPLEDRLFFGRQRNWLAKKQDLLAKTGVGRVTGGLSDWAVDKGAVAILVSVLPEARAKFKAQMEARDRNRAIRPAEARAAAGASDLSSLENILASMAQSMSGAENEMANIATEIGELSGLMEKSDLDLGVAAEKKDINESSNALIDEAKNTYKTDTSIDKGLKIDPDSVADRSIEDIEDEVRAKATAAKAATNDPMVKLAIDNALTGAIQAAHDLKKKITTQEDVRKKDLKDIDEKRNTAPDSLKAKGKEEREKIVKEIEVRQRQLEGNSILDTSEIQKRQDQLKELTERQVRILQGLRDEEALTDKDPNRIKELEAQLKGVHLEMNGMGYGAHMRDRLEAIEIRALDGGDFSAAIEDSTELEKDYTDINNQQKAYANVKGKSGESLVEEYNDLDAKKIKAGANTVLRDKYQAQMTEIGLMINGLGISTTFRNGRINDLDAKKIQKAINDRQTQNKEYFSLSNIGDPKSKNKNVLERYKDQQAYIKKQEEEKKKLFQERSQYQGEYKDQNGNKQERKASDYVVAEQRIGDLKQRQEKLKKKIASQRLESDYIRRQYSWEAIAEEKKIIMTEDSEELMQDYDVAKSRGETDRAKAIVEKMNDDGNINDMIEANGWNANIHGMQSLGKKLMKDLGLTFKDMASFMKDQADIARHNDQWSMAYSHIIKNGTYVEATPEDQYKMSLGMIRKRKPAYGSVSRLAFGWNDPNTGEFNFTPYGLQYILDDPTGFSFALGRGMSTPNVTLNIASKVDMLEKAYPGFTKTNIRDLGISIGQYLRDPRRIPKEGIGEMSEGELRRMIRETYPIELLREFGLSTA